MATTKSKFQSLSARRSSPPTRSKSLQEPNPSPRTHSGALPKPNPSPRTHSGVFRKPNSSPVTNVFLQSPFSPRAFTLKSITLSDWWLTRKGKEKKCLSITGFESKGRTEVRVFSSAIICKRHDSVTLEAVDGITISISGFINHSRSLENGVSSEVCNRFRLGFPYNWEDYNEEEDEKKNVDTELGFSFDDVPVRWLQDVCSLGGCLQRKILADVVGSLRELTGSKPDKECDKSRMSNDVRLVPLVVGVKTRGMVKRSAEAEASIGNRVGTMSERKSVRRKKVAASAEE